MIHKWGLSALQGLHTGNEIALLEGLGVGKVEMIQSLSVPVGLVGGEAMIEGRVLCEARIAHGEGHPARVRRSRY